MVKYRIQKQKGKQKWNVLKNNKIILGGYHSQLKARQAMKRRKAEDKYSYNYQKKPKGGWYIYKYHNANPKRRK